VKEWCVLIGNTLESDIELFFGPITEFDEVIKLDEDITFQAMLKQFGIIKSNAQARDMKRYGPVPEGFTDHIIGKLKRRVTILKITGE
jgi:hypothetical protein